MAGSTKPHTSTHQCRRQPAAHLVALDERDVTYGLLASPGCKANIARARELIAVPMPAVDLLEAHDTADPDAVTDHRPPCPCCGGRMMIVEVFWRGGAPRGPPSGAASEI